MANGKKHEEKELLKPGSSKRKVNRDNRKAAKDRRKLIRNKKSNKWKQEMI